VANKQVNVERTYTLNSRRQTVVQPVSFSWSHVTVPGGYPRQYVKSAVTRLAL